MKRTGSWPETGGYPQIAASIDEVLGIAKVVVLAQAEQDPDSLEKAREPTRFFVQYFYVFNVLAGAGARNPIAQAALLALHPQEISSSSHRGAFLALHDSIARISRTHPKPSAEDIDGGVIQLVLVLRTCKITDNEIREAGGDRLFRMTTALRDLRDSAR